MIVRVRRKMGRRSAPRRLGRGAPAIAATGIGAGFSDAARGGLVGMLSIIASAALAGTGQASVEVEVAAGLMADAWSSVRPMPLVSKQLRELDLAQAYAVQRELVAQMLVEPPAGFKAGLTSPDAWRSFGLDAPIGGVLARSGALVAAPDGSFQIERGDFVVPMLEIELGFRLRRAVTEPIADVDSLRRMATGYVERTKPDPERQDSAMARKRDFATDLEQSLGGEPGMDEPRMEESRMDEPTMEPGIEIVPVVELPDLGFADRNSLQGLDIVAANAAARYYLVGQPFSSSGLATGGRGAAAAVHTTRRSPDTSGPLPLSRSRAAAPADLDINMLQVRLERDGRELLASRAGSVMGDQWQALRWLINHSLAQGWTLAPGQLLITGAIGPMLPLRAGCYTADWGGLQSIRFCASGEAARHATGVVPGSDSGR